MKRKNLAALLLASTIAIFSATCKKEDNGNSRGQGQWNTCPSCSDTLLTIDMDSGFRDCGFQHYYKLGIADEHYPVDSCNFEYYDNHMGGEGDTLQEIGCDKSVFFEWAYGTLWDIGVREGWSGQTDTGLKIGDPLDKFLDLYPNAEKHSDYVWTAGHFKIYLEDKENIKMMGVSRFIRDDWPGDFTIGPYWGPEPWN